MSRRSVLSAFLTVFIVFMSCISAAAAESPATPTDIIIKISRLDQAIKVIDKIAGTENDPPTSSPSYFLRSILFGTDWIDPARSIVIGIHFENMAADTKPAIAAVVPYTRQNEDFHISYSAVSKIDHYIVALPPGEGNVVSDQMAYDLAQASLKKPDTLISVELAASQMLKKADKQIENMLVELDSKLEDPATPPGSPTQEDVKTLLKGLIKAAKQLETFSMGMDISESEVSLLSDATAIKGTELAKLFTRSGESGFSRMGKYRPSHDINFKSASYDFKGMLAFANTLFGEFYKKIGFDLADIENMASHFTGEVGGGMSFNDSDIDIEMIAVLNETGKTKTGFIESVYLPWMMDYGQKMAAFYHQQNPSAPANNIFKKTPETTLSGYKVYGVDCEIPMAMTSASGTEKMKFPLRTTAVGDLLLTASTDERLNELIKIAGTLEKQTYDGPLMTMDIDLGAYLNTVQKMIPATEPGMKADLSKLGRLAYTFDIGKRTLSSKYVVKVDDIRSMVSAFRQAGAGSTAAAAERTYPTDQSFAQSAPTMLQHSAAGQQPKPKKEDTAEFWLDKGLLYATYGNDKEAIKFYKKALQIEPDNTRTLFNIGLSYSSLGHYDLAVSVLNKAIFLAPDNGDYHYGLGWVYLLKGESGKAMDYIRTAADLGNPDAQKYLLKNE